MALSTEDRNWIECHFSKLRELIVENQVAIAILKTKAGIYGLLGGAISTLTLVAIYLMIK